MGRLFDPILGLSVAIGAPAIVAAVFLAFSRGTPLVEEAAPLRAMLLDTTQWFVVHSWITYLGWRGVRYAQKCVGRTSRV